MPISGLLLTLSQEPHLQQQVLSQLPGRAELQIGLLVGRWLPVALAAETDEQCREIHEWLLSLPGIEYADVVCVNFEEMQAPPGREPIGAGAPAEPSTIATEFRA